MKKLKVMTVVGTRPEVIRLSRVISQLDKYCEHALVHTGQNYDYELNQIFFDELKIRKPDYFLEAADSDPTKTIGQIIIAINDVLDKFNPEAMLVLGDTNSCLSVLPAKRRKIPIFHMEAGNRCFDMRVPEEINRRIVDHIADINLPYSSIAREYLLREGLPPDLIIKTGSPMREVLNYYSEDIHKSDILKKLNLTHKNYFVVSLHREENINTEEKVIKLIEVLNMLSERYEIPIIFSAHPRTRKAIEKRVSHLKNNIKLMKPLGFFDYNKLQICSKAVLSDSGTISEESSILAFNALNLREAHERPEAMETAKVPMVGLNSTRIIQALKILENNSGSISLNSNVEDYEVEDVSIKIVKLIHSYTDYIHRVTWKKY